MSDTRLKVAIIAPYTNLPGETKSNRFRTLAEMLSITSDVCLVTSSFDHSLKRRRESPKEDKYKVALIWEPGYSSNTSAIRIISHAFFLLGLIFWIFLRGWRYDKFICAAPFSSSAVICKIFPWKRVIVDVQDIWPEAFSVLHLRPITQRIINLSRHWSTFSLLVADQVVTVSAQFAKRCKDLYPNCRPHIFYIGSEISKNYKRNKQLSIEKDHSIRVVYLGTISVSYDLDLILHVFSKFSGRRVFEIYVIGDGPMKNVLEKKYLPSNNIFFLDYMNITDMSDFCNTCHFAINPIVSDSAGSITNKVSDYFALGIPFISGQNCQEVIDLISSVSPNLCYQPGDGHDLLKLLHWIDETSDSEYLEMQEKTISIGLKMFYRSKIYNQYIELIKSA